MDDKKITPEELKAAWAGDMDELAAKVAAAMNSAQPDNIIDDSEEPGLRGDPAATSRPQDCPRARSSEVRQRWAVQGVQDRLVLRSGQVAQVCGGDRDPNSPCFVVTITGLGSFHPREACASRHRS